LQQEVAELLRLAEEADNESLPDDFVIPEELSRRNERIEAIRQAKAEIERRAAERYEKELEEYQAKMEARQAKEKATGKKAGGREPKSPEGPSPKAQDQLNLTDEESRIMPISGGGFEQCYNAQAAVDVESYIIVMSDVTQHTNDKEELLPALEEFKELPESISSPEKLLADAGYYSEDNVSACEEAGIEAYIPTNREAHYHDVMERLKLVESSVEAAQSPSERVKQRMNTQSGKEIYSRRKCTIEPVFGVIKAVMGFRQFLFRGLSQVKQEWKLVCLAWNLKRLHKMTQKGLNPA